MRRGIEVSLRVRRLREQQALAVLADRTRTARLAVVAAERRREERAGHVVDVDTTIGLLAARAHGVALDDAVEEADAHVAAARLGEDRATRTLQRTATDRRSLERLVERREEQAAAERTQREQRAADDLAVVRREVSW